eukprot:1635999-Pleurochrysis_carterae.AAC.1
MLHHAQLVHSVPMIHRASGHNAAAYEPRCRTLCAHAATMWEHMTSKNVSLAPESDLHAPQLFHCRQRAQNGTGKPELEA